ncbi:hypothetical protein TPA0910_72030 [Streptomyces hygroscopicus subsp. sporocinereus]|uniref:Transposase IS701-like DDE domain-containing protein n=1 Tax=Streptomyces hygroscopicus TaxID=1912 RepID=A0ABQ3UAY5_STRHY|nr:hypothetical protein TPA0910_72030 [Streptomyces hygroscopicus]
MAPWLPDGNEQNLQQFVNQSTWDPVPVRRRIAERMVPRIGPDAWAVDDVSFPKDGKMSVGVAPQYSGALGKQANCQVSARTGSRPPAGPSRRPVPATSGSRRSSAPSAPAPAAPPAPHPWILSAVGPLPGRGAFSWPRRSDEWPGSAVGAPRPPTGEG